jgi:hypothetical protein
VCPGYAKKVRAVPQAEKRQVYAEYGITEHHTGDYEVDHLISLKLCGSNSIKNLWPESYRLRPGMAESKTDWKTSFISLFVAAVRSQDCTTSNRVELDRSLPEVCQSQSAWDGADFAPCFGVEETSGQVWVNTRSGKFWKPGLRFYGRTKKGVYMSEQEAIRKRYQPANGTGE